MCGRFTLSSNAKSLNEYFGTDSELTLKPRYNVSPGTDCPVVRLLDEKKESAHLHWGFIPHWAKNSKLQPINAKAETVEEKPFFRSAFKQQRCLVPANGYYEWKKEGTIKQPYYIHPVESDLMAFAGLWSTWGKADEVIESFTIITTEANPRLSDIHHRMPVILNPDDYDKWLFTGGQELLKPCDENLLESFQVSTQVNNPRNDTSNLINPV